MIRTKRKLKRTAKNELQEYDVMPYGMYKGWLLHEVYPVYFLKALRDKTLPADVKKYVEKRKYQFKREVINQY